MRHGDVRTEAAGVIYLANLLALCACFFVWDLGSWYRERFQGGSFTTIPGFVVAHVGMVVIYVWVTWAALSLASQALPG